ncbi:MAG TPA: DUF885 domain-containing protein [Myxococcales bacterium]|jgi:uncharacterized protein (DUF885 family)
MKLRYLAVIAFAACSHAKTTPPHDDFEKFSQSYFKASFARSPSRATRTGFHEGYDDRLEDLSRPAIDKEIHDLHAEAEEVARIRREQLSFDDAIDAELIDNQIHSTLLDLETLRPWERNPMTYARLPGGSIDGLMKRDFAPAPQRLKSVIARLRQVPALYAAGKANLKNPPKEYTQLAIRLARGSVGFFQKAVTDFAHNAAANDPQLMAQFEEANKAAQDSARDFSEWLQNDLLPRSNGQYAIGAETFLLKLRYDDMVELPLPELLAKGEAQLKKDHAAFVEVAKRIDPSKSPHEVMDMLSQTHPTADDLIPAVGRSVEEARKFVVEKDLVTVPSEVRVKVQPTPPYARAATFASMDTPGPFEHKATEAFYYVTPVEQDWPEQRKEEHLRLYNPWVVGMINVHEAYPGHYLEFLYAPKFPTFTRKLTHSSSNSEGWAHYCEQMTVEQGFGGGDPRMQLAQLSEALVRDCRYVVGVQLHTAGWTVDQGAALFHDQCFMEPANGREEAMRGTYNPTYLYYTLGKLEIQDLAREYMAKKHATLKEFHNAFVVQGALPVPLVRKILLRE